MNQKLRDHVTSAKFVLALGPTHIAALAWLEWELRYDLAPEARHAMWGKGPYGTPWNRMVPGQQGVYDRGLAVHFPFTGPGPVDNRPASERWQITPAGQAVIFLLKEAGVWDEYACLLPDPTTATKGRS